MAPQYRWGTTQPMGGVWPLSTAGVRPTQWEVYGPLSTLTGVRPNQWELYGPSVPLGYDPPNGKCMALCRLSLGYDPTNGRCMAPQYHWGTTHPMGGVWPSVDSHWGTYDLGVWPLSTTGVRPTQWEVYGPSVPLGYDPPNGRCMAPQYHWGTTYRG